MAENDLLEQPVLDLKVKKEENLPESVPDVFEEAEYEDVVLNEKTIELSSLIDDVEVLIKVDDLDGAKREYKNLMNIFNRLPLEKKKEFFDRVNKLYEDIKHPGAVQKAYMKSLSD